MKSAIQKLSMAAAMIASIAGSAVASAPANAPVTLAPRPFSMTVPTPTGGDALIQEARRRSCRTVCYGKSGRPYSTPQYCVKRCD